MISKKYDLLKPFLDEKSKRLFAAAEALSIGTGNISIVSRATGISENTIKKGCNELESGKSLSDDKIRAPGGGRKKSVDKTLLFCPILRHLLNQQVVGIRNLLYVGLVKVFEI